VLHGRKTVSYIGGADEPPVTMDMHSVSHSWEVPQLNTIDPVGLDYLLRIFIVSKTT